MNSKCAYISDVTGFTGIHKNPVILTYDWKKNVNWTSYMGSLMAVKLLYLKSRHLNITSSFIHILASSEQIRSHVRPIASSNVESIIGIYNILAHISETLSKYNICADFQHFKCFEEAKQDHFACLFAIFTLRVNESMAIYQVSFLSILIQK